MLNVSSYPKLNQYNKRVNTLKKTVAIGSFVILSAIGAACTKEHEDEMAPQIIKENIDVKVDTTKMHGYSFNIVI